MFVEFGEFYGNYVENFFFFGRSFVFLKILIFMLKWMLKNIKNNFVYVVLFYYVLWIFFREFLLIFIILCFENMFVLFYIYIVNMYICFLL